jgi:hypothetical protein
MHDGASDTRDTRSLTVFYLWTLAKCVRVELFAVPLGQHSGNNGILPDKNGDEKIVLILEAGAPGDGSGSSPSSC